MRAIKIIVPVILTVLLFTGIFYYVVVIRSAPQHLVEERPIPTALVPVVTAPQSAHIPYTATEATAESALFARDAITHLTFYSGLGELMQPGADEVSNWLHANGVNRDHPPFENAAFLKVPYVRGNSLLPNAQLSLLDAITYRWNTTERHAKVTPEVVASGMNAELELAAVYVTGTDTEDKRFEAIALAREASEGMKFLEEHMKLPNGLYASAWQGGKVVSENVDLVQQGKVLEAYAHLIDYAESFPAYYISPVESAAARTAFDALLRAIRTYVSDDETRLTTLSRADKAHLMKSFSWYIALSTTGKLNGDARTMLKLASDSLKLAENTGDTARDVLTEAAEVQGFGLASIVTSDIGLERDAAGAWAALDSLWDEDTRTYRNASDTVQPVFITPETVSEIVAAFRIAKLIPPQMIAEQQSLQTESASGSSVTPATEQQSMLLPTDTGNRFAEIVETLVKESGLLPSEDREAEALIPNDGVPLTTLVHKAPVFVAQSAYLPADKKWALLDANVDVAAAFDLSSELLRFTKNAATHHTTDSGIPTATQ